MGTVSYKEACPRCRSKGHDNTGDNLVAYTDGSAHCFRCHFTIRSKQEGEEPEGFVESMAEFTKEDNIKLKKQTTYKGKNLRGIKDETYKHFGVLHEYDSETGQPIKQFYPCTINYELSGYKVRELPKTFFSLGKVGQSNELFGQFRFKSSSSKWVLLVGGEVDQLSAYQMLRDYQISKGNEDYEPTPVVSPSVGETGCAKQLQAQYEWFNRFERIIVCFDNDGAGKEATEKAVAVLPQGKVFTMELTLKDPNEYLKEGKEQQFLSAFFAAKKYSPAGIVGSDSLLQRVKEHVMQPKIPLPPFMRKLTELTAGGFPLGSIINIGAATGAGKTSVVNEMLYFWIFNCPVPTGVVTMELGAGQYGEVMLSRHLSRKIALIPENADKLRFIESQEHNAIELFTDEEGNPRWYLIEETEGDIENLKKLVEQLVITCGCKLIVLDPIQDILDGLDNEAQAVFMKWQKKMVKRGITFININHLRKGADSSSDAGTGAFVTEADFHGSSTIMKSGHLNLLLMRNKYAEDEIERNTTKAMVSKCRWTGLTGPAGEIYYDNPTHTLFDKEEWVARQSVEY